MIPKGVRQSPDRVCGYYFDKGTKVTVKMTDDGEDMVLIEGKREALEFLGNLLLAQAQYDKDCSFFIGPRTAGRALFNRNSTLGLYIHRLPCIEEAR